MEGASRKVIIIYGGGSGSGKTALAEALLGLLPGWAAVKLTPSALYTACTIEGRPPEPGERDTARLARAGADPVLHLQAPAGELPEALAEALAHLPPARPVLIEGRGALDCLRPDLAILVWRPGLPDHKGRLEELASGADLVFVNGAGDRTVAAADVPGGPRLVHGYLGPDGARLGDLPDLLRERGIG